MSDGQTKREICKATLCIMRLPIESEAILMRNCSKFKSEIKTELVRRNKVTKGDISVIRTSCTVQYWCSSITVYINLISLLKLRQTIPRIYKVTSVFTGTVTARYHRMDTILVRWILALGYLSCSQMLLRMSGIIVGGIYACLKN